MRSLLLILLLAVVPFSGSQAATIDLYRGEAVVENKDAAARKLALPQALRHVFQKISGLRSFEDYPLVEASLDNASSILVAFYYRNVTILQSDGSEREELRLVADFAGDKVDEMARLLQLPLWPAERDPVVLWVVVDNGLDRRIMPVEFDYVWASIGNAARWRGLPLDWPAPDEEGMFAVDEQLLWGGYTEDLGLAPGAGAMIAAARREGLEWSVRINLSYGGENWTWRVQEIDLQAALTESMHQSIDLVASANAIAASDLGTWKHQVTVHGINNAGEYEQCLAYLQKLSIVNQVSVVSAGPGRVVFGLELNAVPTYLQEVLADGGVLEQSEDEESFHFSQ